MLYINEGNKLTADEVQVVGADQVRPLVAEGWRILGVLGTTLPGFPGRAELSWQDSSNSLNDRRANVEIPSAAVFTPQFIMGRDNVQAALVERVTVAEDKVGKMEAQVASLSIQNEGLQDTADTAITNSAANTKAQDARVRDLQEELVGLNEAVKAQDAHVEKVRRGVGEARWREILDAADVEDALGGDDSDVPF